MDDLKQTFEVKRVALFVSTQALLLLVKDMGGDVSIVRVRTLKLFNFLPNPTTPHQQVVPRVYGIFSPRRQSLSVNLVALHVKLRQPGQRWVMATFVCHSESDFNTLEDVLPRVEKERRRHRGRLSRQFVVILEEDGAMVGLLLFEGHSN